jgi:hypothetical protein
MRFHYLVRMVHERFDLLKRNLTPSHFLNGMLGDSEVQTQQFFTRDPLQPTPSASHTKATSSATDRISLKRLRLGLTSVRLRE